MLRLRVSRQTAISLGQAAPLRAGNASRLCEAGVLGARVAEEGPEAAPFSLGRHQTFLIVGFTFEFKRNRFLGSYLFFTPTKRS